MARNPFYSSAKQLFKMESQNWRTRKSKNLKNEEKVCEGKRKRGVMGEKYDRRTDEYNISCTTFRKFNWEVKECMKEKIIE